MEQNKPVTVASRAAKSFIVLGLRQVFVQGLNVIGTIFLARLLTPEQFGVYAILVFLQTFLVAFGGTGLAANLIRQHDEPEDADLRTVFSFQQIVVLILAAGLWFCSPVLVHLYGRPETDVWVFRLVAVAFVLTASMVIPQVLLERELSFHKLAATEISQAIVFNVIAVAFAARGYGTLSLGIALLGRATVGALIVNLVKRWRPGWHWNWTILRVHLQFGLFYQGAQFIALVKDSISPLLIGLLLGVADVGYINWAGMVAAYPVLVLMAMQRVYLPFFSRYQSEPRQMVHYLQIIVWVTNAICAPLAIMTAIYIVPLAHFVFGEKWLPAIPIFYLLSFANLLVPSVTPIIGLLNAVGRARTTFKLSLLWMIATWLLSLPMILTFGPIGFAIGNVGVQLTNLLVFRIARKDFGIRIFSSVSRIWILAIAVGGAVYVGERIVHVDSLTKLVLAGLASFGLYALVFSTVFQRRLRLGIALLREAT